MSHQLIKNKPYIFAIYLLSCMYVAQLCHELSIACELFIVAGQFRSENVGLRQKRPQFAPYVTGSWRCFTCQSVAAEANDL
jgi:hypothetical protein